MNIERITTTIQKTRSMGNSDRNLVAQIAYCIAVNLPLPAEGVNDCCVYYRTIHLGKVNELLSGVNEQHPIRVGEIVGLVQSLWVQRYRLLHPRPNQFWDAGLYLTKESIPPIYLTELKELIDCNEEKATINIYHELYQQIHFYFKDGDVLGVNEKEKFAGV